MDFNNLNEIVQIPIESKFVKISTHSRLLEQRISEWLGYDYQFIGNVIACFEELSNRIELTDEDIGNLSFRCLDRCGEILNIRLSYDGEMNRDRLISVNNGVDEKRCQLIVEGNKLNLLLVSYKRLGKPIKKTKKFNFKG